MNEGTARKLAKQRMREIGKTRNEYHIESVGVVGTALDRSEGKISLNAFNQYYYLVNDESYYGLEIISDSAYFNADDHTNNTRLEFTGQIQIRKRIPDGNWSIEEFEFGGLATQKPLRFIRVTIF